MTRNLLAALATLLTSGVSLQEAIDKAGSAVNLIWRPNAPLWSVPIVAPEFVGWAAEQAHAVEILEVTRLREDMGEKTVAVDAFEGNNLVLVDEGHRGASAGGEGSWMKFRNALCEKGFSFEYSATFGQAVKGSPGLSDRYAKCILFDYSYKFFYDDGYGKDFNILNLAEEHEDEEGRAEGKLNQCLAALRAFEPANDTEWSFIHASSQLERRYRLPCHSWFPVHIFGKNRSV